MKSNCRKHIGVFFVVLLVSAFIISALPQQSYAMGSLFRKTVPNVVNKTYQDASSMLRRAGLVMHVVGHKITANPRLRGLVAEQDPRTGAKVPPRYAVKVKLWRYQPPAVRVPSVVGKLDREAQSLLSRARLRMQVAGILPTPDRRRDRHVQAQVPGPGTNVRLGTVIRVKLYQYRPSQVTVPPVMGKIDREAVIILRRARLRMQVAGTVPTTDSKRDKIVARQDLRPGTKTKLGSVVKVWLFQYQASQVTVPPVMGKTDREAAGILGRLGLRMQVAGIIPTPDSNRDKRVARQDLRPGTKVNRGSVVKVWLYRYQASQVTVPSVMGKTDREAASILGRLGLRMQDAGTIPTPDSNRDKRVARQDLRPGTKVNRGSVVKVWLFQYKALLQVTTVPNVVGKTDREAYGILSKAGLRMQVVDNRTTDDTNRNRRVMSQDPRAGTNAGKGTVVKVVLYKLLESPPQQHQQQQ